MGLDPAWTEEFERRFDEERQRIGRFNVLICGKTGVGKSTLINAIFGADVAPTGNGVPVTLGTEYFAHDRLPLGVFDTQGFETGEAGDRILARLADEIRTRADGPINDQVHVVWYVVRSPDRRFEDSQAEFVRRLASMGLPVIVVLSQVAVRDGHLHPDALELAAAIETRALPTRPGAAPILTNARVDPWVTPELHGLHDLLDATAEVIPESVQAALEAAQRIDLQRKRRRARLAIRTATTAAAGTCAVPLPIADAAALFPVQMGMLAAISAAYGVPTPSSRLVQAFGGIVVATGASTVGRYLAGTIIKLVPGAGTVTGFAIKAGVASSVTLCMGYAWMTVNERLVTMTESEAAAFLDSDQVRTAFVDAFSSAWRNRRRLTGDEAQQL
ncbi:MAG: GTPase [Candidatus Nanopelagicales bacterium]